MTFLESSSRSIFLFEHDLFGKPLHTFPDHALLHFGAGFRPDARTVPAGETEIVTIPLYDASVGVFVPYLGNLSGLLDHAAAHAKARNIDPAVLLNMRLAPNMYSLKQQVA